MLRSKATKNPKPHVYRKDHDMILRNFRNEARDDYLEAILQITLEKGYCRSIDIANELAVSKPSVSVAVNKLEENGLLVMGEDKLLRLTEEGRALAEVTLEKHVYLMSFLMQAGVEKEIAEKEACAMEHGISNESFRLLRERYPLS